MGRANQQTTLCRCGPVCLNTLSSPIRILQAFSFHDLRGIFCILYWGRPIMGLSIVHFFFIFKTCFMNRFTTIDYGR